MNKLLLVVSVLLSAFLVMPANAQIPKKPNIIWLMAEDMSLDLGCYGMAAVKTPNLDKMAKDGILYYNAMCTNPICSPSRSAMMTGVQQDMIDAHNHRSNREKSLRLDVKPFTYYLRKCGYTCILGNNLVYTKGEKIDCNFKWEKTGSWDGITHFGLFDKLDNFTKKDEPFFSQIQLLRTHRGDWWKETTAESKHPVNPNDVVLPPYLPNVPKVRQEFASYLDQIEYADNEVSLLINDLNKKGMLDHTIIIFIGDNGRDEVKGKGYLYTPGLNIPMIAWGNGIKPGQRVKQIVSSLDITASILDLAGVKIPDYYIGKPLFNKETGKAIGGEDSFYGARDTWDEIPDCSRSISTLKYEYIRNYKPEIPWDAHQQYLDFYRPAIHVLRKMKAEGKLDVAQLLFMRDRKPKEELFDVVNDPYEIHDLAENPKYQDVLATMKTKMDKWQATHEDDGLLDRNNRHPQDMGNVRGWIKQYKPKVWKSITDGDLFVDYNKMNEEYNQFLKNQKK